MLYSIEDKTLTALGDAVRNKAGKYVSGFTEPIMEPFVDITIDTTIMEPTDADTNWTYFNVPIDLTDYMGYPYLYYIYEYETNKRYYASHSGCYLYWNQTTVNEFVAPADKELIKTGTQYITPRTSNPFVQVILNKNAYERDATVIFKLKLWFCDNDKTFYQYNTMTPLEMVDAINNISVVKPIKITGTGREAFKGLSGTLLVDIAGSNITTSDITELTQMFYSNECEEIPFEINCRPNYETLSSTEMFRSCKKLKTPPKINNYYKGNSNSMFSGCCSIREFPEDYFDNWQWSSHRGSYNTHNSMFSACYSLRKLPSSLIKGCWGTRGGTYNPHYQAFYNCSCLDEINGLVISEEGVFTSNIYAETFTLCQRLKNFTFEINPDGTPKTAQWKSQSIYLGGAVGYVTAVPNEIIGYNSGITADKEVKDDATYQALKNDPDWFSRDINYSRYNHDSAVATINSLPDTSAYLSANGGTNTITFRGQCGALTDGGAINTLTEEEIAVATAKGWTVSLV